VSAITIEIADLPESVRAAIEKAANGEEVVFTTSGEPMARLTPVRPRRPFIFNMHPGAMTMTPDFDDPIDEEDFLRGDF
jgi:antitoxin (DNA-binding transcriptional repressor) of toxin-antitoxin stability system